MKKKSSAKSKKEKKPDSAREDKLRGELLYLYGISEKPSGGIQVDGVEAVACGDLICWVSRVDAKEYGEELQTHMQNLDWLAGASVRHQRIVSAIHEQATMLPARFATLFVSQESLKADVKRRAQQLKADMSRVKDADEFGLKMFAVPKTAAPIMGDSGRDYLTRKSQILRQSTTVKMSPEVEKFIGELQNISRESAAGGSVSGGQKNLAWQGSLLVPRAERRRLEQWLAEFHRRHGHEFRIECTGPWPPYSFAGRGSDK